MINRILFGFYYMTEVVTLWVQHLRSSSNDPDFFYHLSGTYFDWMHDKNYLGKWNTEI